MAPPPLKNQYFLSPEYQKSIFSFPGTPKINIFAPRSTKNQYFSPQSIINQYFLSLERQKSIFSIPGAPKINIFYPGAPKINIFCPRGTKNQYFLSPEHEKSIFSIPRAPQFKDFSLRIRITNNQSPSAVAGTQLCCALDKLKKF